MRAVWTRRAFWVRWLLTSTPRLLVSWVRINSTPPVVPHGELCIRELILRSSFFKRCTMHFLKKRNEWKDPTKNGVSQLHRDRFYRSDSQPDVWITEAFFFSQQTKAHANLNEENCYIIIITVFYNFKNACNAPAEVDDLLGGSLPLPHLLFFVLRNYFSGFLPAHTS